MINTADRSTWESDIDKSAIDALFNMSILGDIQKTQSINKNMLSMKKLHEILGKLIMVLAVIFAMSACETADDVDDDIDDIINKGETLDDGYYIVGSAIGSDTTDANVLVSGQVNGPDFGAQDRTGFYEAYVYMASGDFSFIKVVEGEISAFGGAHEELVNGDPAELTIYSGAYSDDATGTSPVDGSLVHVMIDESTGQYVVIPVNYWEVIGGATADGWGSGQEIALKSASADEVVFEATKVVLREGDFKLRFDSNWSMNLEEEECDVNETACLNYFTNFGGTITELVHGGGNIIFDGTEGEYTITITYTPDEGNSISASLERTGDAPEVTFDPEEYKFGIIGDATAGAWDSDQDMFYKGTIDGVHTWLAVMTFGAEGAFKFRTNDDWAFALGGTLLGDGSAGDISTSGGDIPTPGEGAYYIKLQTADEGTTWTSTMTNTGWGVIGDGSPVGNWDSDMDMTAAGYADGVTTYSITGDFTTGEWKFRAGDAWDYNIGGDMAALTADGGNLTLAEAGTYEVVLSFDGSAYSATATKQ